MSNLFIYFCKKTFMTKKERVKKIMREKGDSIKDLANMMGLSPNTINHNLNNTMLNSFIEKFNDIYKVNIPLNKPKKVGYTDKQKAKAAANKAALKKAVDKVSDCPNHHLAYILGISQQYARLLMCDKSRNLINRKHLKIINKAFKLNLIHHLDV